MAFEGPTRVSALHSCATFQPIQPILVRPSLLPPPQKDFPRIENDANLFPYRLGFNEATRRFFAEGRDTKDLPPSVLLMAGGFGGFMYWILTYPTDVIKSR